MTDIESSGVSMDAAEPCTTENHCQSVYSQAYDCICHRCSAERFRSDIVRIGNGSVNSSAPKFATSNAKSDMDWIIKNASSLPSCQQYGNTSPVVLNKTSAFQSSESGGYMARSNGIDAEAMRRRLSASFPGPGAYGNPAIETPSGGRMSTSKNITGLDVHVKTFRHVPGPGAYPLPQFDRYRPIKEPPAGRFSQSSLMAGSMYSNLKDTPAPDQYQNGNSSFLGGTVGGRISSSNRTTELDEKIRLGKTLPGPGNYAAENAYGAFKHKYLWQPFNDFSKTVEKRQRAAGDIVDLRATLGTGVLRSSRGWGSPGSTCAVEYPGYVRPSAMAGVIETGGSEEGDSLGATSATSPLETIEANLMSRMRALTACDSEERERRSRNTRPW